MPVPVLAPALVLEEDDIGLGRLVIPLPLCWEVDANDDEGVLLLITVSEFRGN